MNRAKSKQSAAVSHRGEDAATASSSICSSENPERENESVQNAEAIFVGGPPVGLQRRFGLVRLSGDNTLVRAAIAVAIGWLPLAVMTAVQHLANHDGGFLSFVSDYGAHARYLIALPLLVLADVVCSPSQGVLIYQFRDTGLTASGDIVRLERAIRSSIALRDSAKFEAGVAVVAFAIVAAIFYVTPLKIVPAWNHFGIEGSFRLTPAGWWQTLVSLPLLAMLVLGWLWRLVLLWARLLFLISRLKLNFLAPHPDKRGGLKFLGISLKAYSIVVFAFGTIVAGTVANRATHDGIPLGDFRYAIAGFTVLMLALFAGPLLVFSKKLHALRDEGTFLYGSLAHRVGRELENAWLSGEVSGNQSRRLADFSATIDFFSVSANVYSINIIPISLTNVVPFLVATLLPSYRSFS